MLKQQPTGLNKKPATVVDSDSSTPRKHIYLGAPWLLTLLLWGVLATTSLTTMTLQVFLGLSALLSVLVFIYLYAGMLLKRRAYVSMLANPQSPWRGRLWHSVLATFLTAGTTMLVTAAIWIVAAQLSWQEWMIFAVSLVSYWLIKKAITPWVVANVTLPYQLLTQVRLAHWLNLTVLCLLLLAAHYWWLDVPDTRAYSLTGTMQQAYSQHADDSRLQIAGMIAGAHAALHAGVWHLTQLVATVGPWWLTIIVWLGVVLGLVVQASMLWLPALGLQMLFLRPEASTVGTENASDGLRRGLAIWCLIMVFVSVIVWRMEAQTSVRSWFMQVSAGAESTPNSANPHQADPCTDEHVAAQREMFTTQNAQLRNTHQSAVQAQAEALVAAHVEQAFASGEIAVDAFLDWNFSLAGQYMQLAMLARTGFNQRDFEQRLEAQIGEFLHLELTPALALQDSHLTASLMQLIQTETVALNHQLTAAAAAQQNLCWSLTPVRLDIEALTHRSAVGAGVVPGLALMSRALAPGSALLARSGTRRVVAALGGRMAARAGTSAGAATAGSVCGPLCMFVAGAATWVGTDLALNYASERMHREAMKTQLMQAVEEQQQHLQQLLINDLTIWLTRIFDEVEAQQNARFNLSRELSRNNSRALEHD